MKLIHAARDLEPGQRKICLAIGVFDGVHLGHQQIIRQTVSDAQQSGAVVLVITFDRHPNAIVAPSRVPPLIYSGPQKQRAIEALGAEALLEIPFDREFSQLTGEAFVRQLRRELGTIQSICVGADFLFGHKRSGDVPLLHRLGRELQFQVHGLAAISLAGQIVSSTRIRKTIRAGHFEAASQMLGRPYAIAGRVVHGDQLGHQIGFPTANLDTTGRLLPPQGVYAAAVQLGRQTLRAAVNIGIRPTLQQPDPGPRVEVHLLDFQGDLYGEELEVTLVNKLRDEQRFASLEILQAQIQRDVLAARAAF